MVNASDINAQYQKYLGRDATKSEIDDFNRFQNTGYVDLTGEDLGRIIQSHPDYQLSQMKNYGNQYSDLLGQSDQRFLNMAQNNLTGQFAEMGRNPTSSGYVNAFANAAANLASQRQNTLANYYGQGFGNLLGNQFNVGRQTYGQGVGSQETGVRRNWDIADYYRQKNDYQGALHQQGIRNLQGSLLNAGIGMGGQAGFGSLYGGANYLSGGSGGFGGGFMQGMGML